MKRVPMTIEEMPSALEALNNSIQLAMMNMIQKGVSEATAAISVHIEVDPISGHPKIDFKTTVRVPIEMSDKGSAVRASQIEWDEDLHSFVMLIDGEQVKIEE